MTLYLAALSFGFLGSLHCVGMCGGFAGALTIRRQKYAGGIFLYQAGRIGAYALAGIIAGLFGAGLEFAGGSVIRKIVAVAAGISMAVMGLNLAGLIPDPLARLTTRILGKTGLLEKISRMSQNQSLGGWVFLGFLNGLLPCGLVYAALFMSLSAETIFGSALVMAFFGLGTAPAMIAAPALFRALSPRLRSTAVRVSGILLILFGLFSVYRGTLMKQHVHNKDMIHHHNPAEEICDEPGSSMGP